MYIVFVHGWSVTNTDTYGGLPQAVQAAVGPGVAVQHLMLAKYVSFADEVTVDDIARGMQHAVEAEVRPALAANERFVCITHSTGGPVVRQWLAHYYGQDLAACPLGHLIMLAPANHGSALAQLGKGKLARMKFFTEGVEPGTGVLDWLELGSGQSWALNRQWLGLDTAAAGLYSFVLTGQRIDRSFYDNLNTYTGEAGSDGVVRVAAANMNYGYIRLEQTDGGLKAAENLRPPQTAFGVVPGLSHSGDKMGILRSVRPNHTAGMHPTLDAVLKCLTVRDAQSYAQVMADFDALTEETQKAERIEKETVLFLRERTFKTSRYCMLVFRLTDDRGNRLADYDVLFTAGPDYQENHLPEGFFVDRQRNQVDHGKLTYYVDYDVLKKGLKSGGNFGIKIVARPQAGFAYYTAAEYRGTFGGLKQYVEPNRTLMIEVQMRRHVGEGIFQLTDQPGPESFKSADPGKDIED